MHSTSVVGRRFVSDHHIPAPFPKSFDGATKVLRTDATGLDLQERLDGRACIPVAGPPLSQDNHQSRQAGLIHSGQLPAVPDNPPSGEAEPWAEQNGHRMTNVSNAHDLPSTADGDLGARRQTHEGRPLKPATGVWSV